MVVNIDVITAMVQDGGRSSALVSAQCGRFMGTITYFQFFSVVPVIFPRLYQTC